MKRSRPAGSRPWSLAKLADILLALVAHALVGLAWVVTALAVMGSLGVGRRILMNSEWAWDTGRLPQPWVIPIGLIAIGLAHVLFRWSMRRVTRGEAAWGPSVVAWAGAFLGAALGAYLWPGPVQVGQKVGPAMGQSTPWDALVWIAYYARLWLPGLIGLVTAVLFFVSKNSPLVVWVKGRRGRRVAPAAS